VTRAETRKEKKLRSREALVAAALELFAEQGLDLPSLDAICERAGYTRGAFYVHFKDREALVVAVMDAVGEAFLGSIFEAGGAEKLPAKGRSVRGRAQRGRLRAAIRRFVSAVAKGRYPLMAPGAPSKPLVRPHQLLDACARSDAIRARYRGLVEASIGAIAALAREDQRDQAMRRDIDAEAVGTIALAVVIGAQTMSELGLPIDAARLARTVERLVRAT
jgi:TetR/AcrR family transcriptional regulator, transcriptional repressor for nem operon